MPCNDPHQLTLDGQQVRVFCSINHGHDGGHQAYYRDRLHEWPRKEPA